MSVLFLLCAACEACGGGQAEAPGTDPGSPPPASPANATDTPDPEPAALPTNLVDSTPEAQDAFSRGSNRFAFDLFRGRPAGNQVFSPGSISLALGMTWAGARGETAAQLARPFGFEDSTHAAAAGLLNAYNQEGSPLAVANRLFGEESFDLRAEFLALAQARYAAPFEGLDFRQDADGAREHINTWVADRTHDRIQNLLPPGAVDETTRLVLVNAAYFLGHWAVPFARAATRPEVFQTTATSEVRVPMMNHRLHVRSATVAGARVLELPYEGDRFAMVFVLPEARHGLAALEGGLDAAQWERFMGGLQAGEAVVAIPRFEVKLEPSLSLVESLRQMGVVHAFDPAQADFSGMAAPLPNVGPLVVGNVLHQAFLRVDESGTEAAAATAVAMGDGAGPAAAVPVFRLDEPFLFALCDRQSGMILFLGRVTDPS